MKGKLLFSEISKPSVVFFTGILVVLFFVSIFGSLQVRAVEEVDAIQEKIEQVDREIIGILLSDENQQAKITELNEHIAAIWSSPIIKGLYEVLPENMPQVAELFVNDKEDFFELSEKINSLSRNITEHTESRDATFRTLSFLFMVVLIFMVLLLGVNQFENFKLIRSEKRRNETNVKLYDQLEKERSLIAFELHDDIAQKLAVIKRYFNSRNSIDEQYNLMEHYATDVIKRVRYLSRMLKAPDNPDVSFKDYLETLFSDFNVLSDFKLNRKTVGLNALKLTPTASLHIYRIIQEVLTNSRIHSEATEIDLLLVYSHPTLTIKYKDNGKGFDPYLVYRKGIGLDSIKYRLDLLKGEYRLNSAEGEGTDISIDIPVELCETS